MKCVRCGGFMFRDEFRQWGKIYPYFHCVQCGELVDPIILKNRLDSINGKHPKKETKPRFHWT
jgi:hypothetical protein